MKKDEAFKIKQLWEEITSLEKLANEDNSHSLDSLEYLARRLHEASKCNYPNTVFKLYDIKEQALRFIQTEIAALAKQLNEELEKYKIENN